MTRFPTQPAPHSAGNGRDRIVSLDLSLTRTGYATGQSAGVLVPPKGHDRGIVRLIWIRDAVLDLTAAAGIVVLEGYSYASRGNAIVSMGELGGVIRVALVEAGRPYVDVAPAARAKYATGKGNAGKDQVLAEAIRRLGYTGYDHNEADALWLREMALDWYGLSSNTLPKTHRDSLHKVPWPSLQAWRKAPAAAQAD